LGACIGGAACSKSVTVKPLAETLSAISEICGLSFRGFFGFEQLAQRGRARLRSSAVRKISFCPQMAHIDLFPIKPKKRARQLAHQ
jgi:hypothetical protein